MSNEIKRRESRVKRRRVQPKRTFKRWINTASNSKIFRVIVGDEQVFPSDKLNGIRRTNIATETPEQFDVKPGFLQKSVGAAGFLVASCVRVFRNAADSIAAYIHNSWWFQFLLGASLAFGLLILVIWIGTCCFGLDGTCLSLPGCELGNENYEFGNKNWVIIGQQRRQFRLRQAINVRT